MAEYIDRDAVCYQLQKQSMIDGQPRAIRRAAKIVAAFQAADVVEVVRCKDCINHRQSGLCEGWSRYGTINTTDDAFCSYGVKIDV